MRAAVVAAVAAAVVVALRRWRRRGGGAGRRDRPLLGDTGLVAGREVRERLRGRVFRAVTAVLFAAVGAAVVVPTLGSSPSRLERVGVVGVGAAPLAAELRAVAAGGRWSASIAHFPSLAPARRALAAGRLDVVVDPPGLVLVRTGADAGPGTYAGAVAGSLGAEEAFSRAGLTPAQAATVARARPLPVEPLHPSEAGRTSAESTALVGVILIFVVLSQYLTWTLMGVMEEKANRVVEILLATTRPLQLLAGKVLGIGVVALAQAVALVVFALVLGGAVGSSLVHGAGPVVVGATLTWLVLGYAFYSWVYAAAGSLAERQDQVQTLALPLSAPLVFGYVVSLVGVSSGHASTLVQVLAYLPPTAPMAMPVLVGVGQATWWGFALSVAASLAGTALVAVAAARVYRTAVLRTGSRVRLRDVVAARW